MFGLGPWEFLVIVAVAIVFIGPEKIPQVATTLGHWYRKIMETTNTVKREFDAELKNTLPTTPPSPFPQPAPRPSDLPKEETDKPHDTPTHNLY